jgi:hypothetical protein
MREQIAGPHAFIERDADISFSPPQSPVASRGGAFSLMLGGSDIPVFLLKNKRRR